MNMSKIERLVEQFNSAKLKGANNEYLNKLAEKIQSCNMLTYDQQTTFVERRNRISDFELQKWQRLASYLNNEKNKVFDAAFGSGRDIIIANNLGYDVYGCELSDYLYRDFLSYSGYKSNKLVMADLREIPFPSNFFDIVRHNASFLHMPLIGKGYTVHKCLAESYRIMKNDGVLYIFTKEGTGFNVIDTGDGLGPRSFQLYDEETIGGLLNEFGFRIITINHYERDRNGIFIKWIEVFAKKRG